MRRLLLVALIVVLTGPGLALAHSLGWAVGHSGLILHSKTSGSSWMPQTSGTSADLRGVAFWRRVWGLAVGDGGVILQTLNGGVWSEVTSGTTKNLYAVAFAARSTAWAVGEGGTILKTDSGGSSWQPQASGTGQILYGVDFIDADTGWVVGTNGAILHTSDGGSVWSAQTSSMAGAFYGVDFIDGDTGWAVGYGGTIMHTTDGGATWAPQVSGALAELRAVAFVDASTGWVVGAENVLLRTTDGGASWISYDPLLIEGWDADFRGVAFLSAKRGTAVGIGSLPVFDGAALHTGTGGVKWDLRAIPESAQLESVAFVAHSEHWAGDDPCRSQCELAAGSCEERSRSEFADHPQAVQDLIAWASGRDCSGLFYTAIEGSCADGRVLFTHRFDFSTSVTHFYDSSTLQFTGLTTGTDMLTFPCHGAGYWPGPISCPGATVTAVHCGTAHSVDDPFWTPAYGSIPIEGAFFYMERVPALPVAASVVVIGGILLTVGARVLPTRTGRRRGRRPK